MGRGKRPTSPLLGFNTSLRHLNETLHIQTEDSGLERPHVVTQLFAGGGRIIAKRKTGYARLLETQACASLVAQLIRAQHRAMFVAVQKGRYDALIAGPDALPQEEPPFDLAALEARLATRSDQRPDPPREDGGGSGRSQQSWGEAPPKPSNDGPGYVLDEGLSAQALFRNAIDELSLDEIIVDHVARELDERNGG